MNCAVNGSIVDTSSLIPLVSVEEVNKAIDDPKGNDIADHGGDADDDDDVDDDDDIDATAAGIPVVTTTKDNGNSLAVKVKKERRRSIKRDGRRVTISDLVVSRYLEENQMCTVTQRKDTITMYADVKGLRLDGQVYTTPSFAYRAAQSLLRNVPITDIPVVSGGRGWLRIVVPDYRGEALVSLSTIRDRFLTDQGRKNDFKGDSISPHSSGPGHGHARLYNNISLITATDTSNITTSNYSEQCHENVSGSTPMHNQNDMRRAALDILGQFCYSKLQLAPRTGLGKMQTLVELFMAPKICFDLLGNIGACTNTLNGVHERTLMPEEVVSWLGIDLNFRPTYQPPRSLQDTITSPKARIHELTVSVESSLNMIKLAFQTYMVTQ